LGEADKMMKLIKSVKIGNLWPLYVGDVSGDQLIANKTLGHFQQEYAPADASLYANAWVDPSDWQNLTDSENAGQLVTESGDVLGFIDGKGKGLLQASSLSRLILHPWDLIYVNEQVIANLTESNNKGEISPAAHIEGVLQVGEGTRILPGVFIEGNVVIGRNCKVGPNCYIRGNTTIGDNCHIGQAVEVKNSLIGHGSSIGHLSYVGDSIIGNKVNFGAATVTSNLRHDGANHRSMSEGNLIDTGRRKFGTIVGEGAHTGIHTAIYPGRKLGPGVSTRPSAVIQKDLT
jgi:bifunctional UDP-N-acetylglucosamine pyrophosphorylase/glucosamine-1-phosphate N-acetyltransferase